MADTPEEQLGAAQKSFDDSAAGLVTAQESMDAASAAFKEDEKNEELKTAFTESETSFNGLQKTHTGLETTLKDLQLSLKGDDGYWPTDWREKYADGDDKMEKRLARYASPQAAIDAMVSAQNKISSGNMSLKLTKESTPEDIKEFRTQNSIPEEPKGYSLDMSEGLVVGDDDKEMLKGFLESAHGSNFSQDQVTAGLEWYYGEQERMQQEQYANDLNFKSAAEDELRQEWGVEYTPNRNLMANFLSSDFEEGIGDLIAGARLADGTMLANHPAILRGFVAKARAANPMGALVPGSGAQQLDAIVDEIAALEARMGDETWYKDKKAQDRYMKLVSARDAGGK
jgi:hypothetical protein